MMNIKYINILMACANEPWALEKTKLVSITQFLRFQALGGKLSASEIARVTDKKASEVRKADGKIGILPIQGVIGEKMNLLDDISGGGGTSTELIGKQFRAMLNDDSIKAIILDINSPGGVARSVQELADEIFAARGIKPIVAQIDTCAASAAYWVASQADEIVVTPSGVAGSIGVYALHEDISQLLADEGVKETFIYNGKYKVIGNQFEPLSEEARSIIQDSVDKLALSFVASVAQGRKVSLTKVNDEFGQGLVFSADELIKRGMADKIGTMSQTLERFGLQLNPALSNKMKENAVQVIQPASLGPWLQFEKWAERVISGASVAPSEFEAILREAGVSKSQRARIASRVHAALQSESGEDEKAQALARLKDVVSKFQF